MWQYIIKTEIIVKHKSDNTIKVPKAIMILFLKLSVKTYI